MRIAELIERFGGRCEGDESLEVADITGLEFAGPDHATFAVDEKSLEAAERSPVCCVVVPPDIRASESKTLIRCDSPKRYAAALLLHFHPPKRPAPGVHPSASVGENSVIAETASIGPHVTIGDNCKVGENVVLMSSVVMGDNCTIGAGTVIHPNATLYADTIVGLGVTIHAGAVIGADGFGYFPEPDGLHKWPHVGNVVIQDNVEIGANACVDRAKFGTTLIEHGVKIDNLVQVGHNCRVGPWSILAGQTGLSGSVTLEQGVVCAGQVGVGDHITVGKGSKIGAQSGIFKDVPAGSQMFGCPAKQLRQAFREVATLGYLAENRPALRRLLKEKRDKEEADRSE